MRVSLMQFITDQTPPPQAVADWAEERGFAGLYVPEKTHVPVSRQTPWPGGELPDWYRRCYDPFVALAAAAAVTTRLQIGTGACLVAVHDPILLAKQIASVSDMSGGRFVLGVGFGWNVEELADHGVAFADRIAVTIDKLGAMRALWAADPTAHTGPFTSLPPSWAWPKPVSAPPVLFGCARAFAPSTSLPATAKVGSRSRVTANCFRPYRICITHLSEPGETPRWRRSACTPRLAALERSTTIARRAWQRWR